MASLVAISDYWWDWGNLLFRWLHVVAAIAWVGSSFYFIALDDHLAPPADERDKRRGVAGESWEIHGGGFYRVEKFRVAPETLPSPLYWFKWEAYTTWLSGFALMVVVFYVHADTFLVDPNVADLSSAEAIAISIAGLVAAWVVYDGLCRLLGRQPVVLAACVFAFVTVSAWAATELFAGRAAYLQVGAMIGTMMVGNVFFVIIPAHWELVRAKQAGREPDPAANERGKLRSVHNNYLTLPVVFAMLSGHFPFTYGHSWSWLILVVLMALGAWTRHYFNLRHRGVNVWAIPATAALGVLVLAVAIRPRETVSRASTGPAPSIATVQAIVRRRCVPCHTGASAPAGVQLDTRRQIEARAQQIEQQAVVTKAMPLGNATGMTQAERDTLGEWVRSR
jgi:uncharacterized membrane protein